MKTKRFRVYLWATIGMELFFTFGCEKDNPIKYAGGSGTLVDPFLIETPKQLDAVKYNLNKHFKQIADIDLSDYGSGEGQSIGYENDPFTGIYDGNGHKITNLTYENKSWFGLFGYTVNSTIKNLGLESINVSLQFGSAGALVGVNKGDIINCYVTGEFSAAGDFGGLVSGNFGTITDCYTSVNVSGDNIIGGLAGVNDGKITDCYATGNVISTGTIVGGLCGGNSGSITNCYVTGDVSGDEDVGGLVGKNTEVFGQNSGNITDSYVTGDVSGNYDVGGLVGWSFGGNITNCNVEGNVTGADVVGGLVGENSGNITNCSTTVVVSGKAYLGGLIGVNLTTKITNSFAAGAVSGNNDVGGLVGVNTYAGSVINCYATGNVTGGYRIGGLVGSNGEQYYEGFIKNSYAAGAVSGNNHLGGLVGEHILGTIEYSYYDKETAGQDDTSKGIPKTTAEMMQQSTFETWDFTDIWKMNEGISYPYLGWQVE